MRSILKSFLSIVILSILVVSCGQQDTTDVTEGYTRISGTLTNAANKTLFYNQYQLQTPQDSTVTDAKGNFSIDVPTGKVDYYKLYFDQMNMIVLILDETTKDLKVTGDGTDFTNSYTVSGSKDSELMNKYFVANRDYMALEQEAIAKINSASAATKSGLQADYKGLKKVYHEKLKSMALANPASPAALSMVSSLNPRDYMDVYDKVFSELDNVIPHSSIYTDMKVDIANYKKKMDKKKAAPTGSMIDEIAPEIAMKNPEGQVVSLSSLRGKYVLIDFWASWCGPCRRENPSVVAMYNKYKDKGLEIYGVSLDKDLNKWKKAIAKDGLEWPHVSDLAGWNSAAAAKYGVKSIPHTVLLDKEGKIIATKLRGNALENKIEELLGS
ncbi:MAG: thiol-disulfide isomerase/thioredoxin [Patiriisocius sp.]|jgi:thiol-disulfide isomerase/thioredoxin